MTQISPIQDIIATLDLDLPWLLPTLEAIEQTVPPTVRLLVCGLLLAWLTVLRIRNAGGHSPAAPVVIQPPAA